MGLSTEQTVAVIEAAKAEPNMNFWHLLWLAVIPVILGWWLNKKGKR